MQLPKITVITLTWGHEEYIEQTLDGIFSQKYDGIIEFIISNDRSPDNTDEIIKNYFLKNSTPNNFDIKYTNHKINKGIIDNTVWSLNKATGKYVALCEGDDYWTDSLKLQKQVDFLEKNKDYCIHGGLAKVYEDGIFSQLIGKHSKNTFVISDFFTKNDLITCTILFRNTPIDPLYFKNIVFADWMLYILILSKNKDGKVYVSNDIFSVYRIHKGGITQTVKSKYKHSLTHFNHIIKINQVVKPKFSYEDKRIIENYSLNVFKYELLYKQYYLSLRTFILTLKLLKFKIPLRKYLFLIRYRKQIKET